MRSYAFAYGQPPISYRQTAEGGSTDLRGFSPRKSVVAPSLTPESYNSK